METVTRPPAICTKLRPNQNICALLEKKELSRDTECIQCDSDLVEKIVLNYIIVKNIISNLSWQEQLLCKLVCKTWRDAATSIQRELLGPQDYVLTRTSKALNFTFKTSTNISTEPLVIINFATNTAVDTTSDCKNFSPLACEQECNDKHNALDVVDQAINSPKQCMLTVKTDYLSYMPLVHSPTSNFTIKRNMLSSLKCFIGGVLIPKIPQVGYHLLNLKMIDMTEEFFNPVGKIMESNYVKGLLVFVTVKYIFHSEQSMDFLNHIKELQPTIPYALGGCITDDAYCTTTDLSSLVDSMNRKKASHITENVITIAMFTVPKVQSEESKIRNNFNMYSLIIEACDWSKANIVKSIKEFSDNIPRFEHSFVLKLSCFGRDQRHDIEQDAFREAFPDTPLVGCYGNGEVGINHPPRTVKPSPKSVKRPRNETENSYSYSYSTVFVYFGWGRMVS